MCGFFNDTVLVLYESRKTSVPIFPEGIFLTEFLLEIT